MKALAFAAVLALALAVPQARGGFETSYAVEFSLPRLGGGEVALSNFRGEWVVINYWATWCVPCRKEIPELSRLHDERQDVTVLGLAFEDSDEQAFDRFLSEFEVAYPVLLVNVYSPPEPFGAPKVLPTTILLNPEGHSVKAFMGPVTREAIEKYIDTQGAGR